MFLDNLSCDDLIFINAGAALQSPPGPNRISIVFKIWLDLPGDIQPIDCSNFVCCFSDLGGFS